MNKGSVETIQQGETLLVAFKGTSNPEKVQIEIAEKIRQATALEFLNEGDSRFGGARARRAWMTIQAAKAKRVWPQLAKEIDQAMKGNNVEVNILNPTANGQQLHVRVTENTVSEILEAFDQATSVSSKKNYQYILENLPTTAKRAGADGGYLTHHGEPIVSRTSVEFGDQSERHIFLDSDPTRLSTLEGLSTGVAIVDEVEESVEEEVEA